MAIACDEPDTTQSVEPAPVPAPMPIPEPPPPPMVNLTISTIANGAILANPADCLESCTLQVGNMVNLTATASEGFIFSEWQCQGSCPSSLTEANLSLTLQEATTILPVFVEGRTFSVVSSDNGIIASADPADCIDDCFVPIGTAITLTAEAGAGYEFSNWECDGVCEITTDGAAVTLTQLISNTTITPIFEPLPRIAFNDDHQIYIVAIDGSNLMQLTSTGPAIENRHPTWITEENRIRFYRNNSEYSINPDGTDLREVENSFEPWLSSFDVRYSTNGLYAASVVGGGISILEQQNTNEGIMVEADINGGRFDVEFAWSLDSEQIAFADFDDDGFYRIRTVNRDGTNLRTVVDNLPGNTFRLNWSPDGTHIAYVIYTPQTRYTLHTVPLNNMGQSQQISTGNFLDLGYTWSLNGDKIAYISSNRGDRGIYIANLDGSVGQQIDVGVGLISNTAWVPASTE